MKQTRAQSSLEFAALITFMFLIFTTFLYLVSQRMVTFQQDNDKIVLEELGSYIQQELYLASAAANGYDRVFDIPPTLLGRNYTVVINSYTGLGINHSEIVVRYLNYVPAYDYTLMLGLPVSGMIDPQTSTSVRVHRVNDAVEVS